MSIAVQFAAPLNPLSDATAEAIRKQFANELPTFEPIQTFMLNIGPAMQYPLPGANPSAISGFSLSKLKADSKPSRVVRAVQSILSVHFMEYTSWRETLPAAVDYIVRCLRHLASLDRNPVAAVLLRYVDRFTFDGPPDEATARKLFQDGNRFVPLTILDCGYQWHANAGWFEPFEQATSVLNQLNVTGAMFEKAAGVNVDHNSLYALPAPSSSVEELIRGSARQLSLEAILDRQHAANASLLRNLLVPEMLRTIGLQE